MEDGSVNELLTNLAFIDCNKTLSDYYKVTLIDSVPWQYFNPILRQWCYINRSYGDEGQYLVFRNGWVVRRLGKNGRHDYYECVSNNLVPLPKESAEVIALGYSPGIFPLPYHQRDNNLFIHIRQVYLPTPFFNALKNLADYVSERDGVIEILVCKVEKKALLDRILNNVRVRLVEKDTFVKPPDVLSKEEYEKYCQRLREISNIFSLLYSSYLKCEDRIEQMIIDISHQEWNNIEPPELAEKIKQVAQMSEGDNVAKTLLNFLLEKLPVYFDWKDLNETITGIIVDGAPLEYQSSWSTNYYKLIVPKLESTIYWQTTLAPTRSGSGAVNRYRSRLEGVTISKWRVYPFMGKIKFTGNRNDVNFYDEVPNSIKQAFYSISGNLSFELILRDFAYIEGYNLDYKTWRGGYNFSRLFLAIARIEEGVYNECAYPTTLVTDIFGNYFRLRWDIDNYIHDKDLFHDLKRGGWISVLVENQLNRVDVDYEIPTFDTAISIGPRFVKREDAFVNNVLGIIHSCGFISEGSLNDLADMSISSVEFRQAIDTLMKSGKIIKENEIYFYVHNQLTTDQARLLAEMTVNSKKRFPDHLVREEWYRSWSRLRTLFPVVHPLIRGKSLFGKPIRNQYAPNSKKYERLFNFVKKESCAHEALRRTIHRERLSLYLGAQKQGIVYYDTLVGSKDLSIYERHASLMLQYYGYATIKARGRWVTKAHEVVQMLEQRYAYADPTVNRVDVSEKNQNGRMVPSVSFDIQIFG